MVPDPPDSQLELPSTTKSPFDSRVEGAFGEFVGKVSAQTKLEFIKELQNKLQWVLGSAYKQRYSGKKGPVHDYAAKIVAAILRDHGYQI